MRILFVLALLCIIVSVGFAAPDVPAEMDTAPDAYLRMKRSPGRFSGIGRLFKKKITKKILRKLAGVALDQAASAVGSDTAAEE